MNGTSRSAKFVMLKCYWLIARVFDHRIYSFEKKDFANRYQSHGIYLLQLREEIYSSFIGVLPSIARLTVWQQEHCTLVAPRMYIRRVWHPPQTNCAISVPAQNSGGKFTPQKMYLRPAAKILLQYYCITKFSENCKTSMGKGLSFDLPKLS